MLLALMIEKWSLTCPFCPRQNEAFIYYSKYTEAQLATPTSFILSAISTDDFEDKFVYQKYSSKKFLKASIFARQWAKQTLESVSRAHELSMK